MYEDDSPAEEFSADVPSAPLMGWEITGARTSDRHFAAKLSNDDLLEVWSRASAAIVKRGFTIEYRSVAAPRTSSFNGQTITIDPEVGIEMQCYILLHLFGHCVQWTAPELEDRLRGVQDAYDLEKFMQALRDHEFEASRLGLQLLHDVGITHLDGWYCDVMASDWRLVKRFYREGRLPSWESCVTRDALLVKPQAIPDVEIRPVEVRFAF